MSICDVRKALIAPPAARAWAASMECGRRTVRPRTRATGGRIVRWPMPLTLAMDASDARSSRIHYARSRPGCLSRIYPDERGGERSLPHASTHKRFQLARDFWADEKLWTGRSGGQFKIWKSAGAGILHASRQVRAWRVRNLLRNLIPAAPVPSGLGPGGDVEREDRDPDDDAEWIDPCDPNDSAPGALRCENAHEEPDRCEREAGAGERK